MVMNKEIAEGVAEIYRFIDLHARQAGTRCQQCGKCCNFEAFGHRIFVTSPEMVYFTHNIKEPLKPAENGQCPYNINGRCSVHEHRFAACRVFYCKGDMDLQSELAESAIMDLKSICKKFGITYRYTDLPTALEGHE
jgi:hypothetical protein